MAAPHVDNPYGAKGAKGKTEDPIKDKDKNKAKADIGQSDSDSDLPKCAHPFCNEPSDPANFPIGLPWASGLLKCLPGYCTKHRKESIAEMMASEDIGEEMELSEFVKVENVCKCKEPPPLACPHKDMLKKDKNNECGKPYPKYVYLDDPCVNQELCFFLRMMMVADEMDRWQEEDQKKEREEAKKRREARKKKHAKSTKSENKDKERKTGNKDKKKKLNGGGKPKNDVEQADKTQPEDETIEK